MFQRFFPEKIPNNPMNVAITQNFLSVSIIESHCLFCNQNKRNILQDDKKKC